MDGIIIINKEKNWTSNDVVQKVKHVLKEKVGHTGTLDPLATGVLPLLIGKGTLLSKYLINHDKEYIATIKLGKKTSTGDEEGEMIDKKSVTSKMLRDTTIQGVIQTFKGEQTQIPPMYSAIKLNGKKLYEYARKGQKVEIEPRKIKIYNIELIEVSFNKQEITIKVNCSKGTYIRTLCEDIAEKLGTVGYMEDLQRTKVGDFSIKNAIKISEIKNYEKNFITVEEFFKNEKSINLDKNQLDKLLNGVKLNTEKEDGIFKVYCNSIFIGCGKVEKKQLKRDIVLTSII